MKVLFVTEQGNAPSIRLRLLDCLDVYRAAGIEPTVFTTHSNVSNRLRVIREAGRHDVVVILKAIGFTPLQLALLQRANRRIVFDFDDAVMFREEKYGRPLRARTFEKFLRTIKRCVAVVAGNNFLRCFAEGEGRHVITLPTPIDLAKYRVKEHADGAALVIGWIGLSDGFRYIRDIAPALGRVVKSRPGVRFKVVSDKPLALDDIAVINETWRLEAEQANLTSFDVGVMPLRDSVYARGKCGYKILQYMAAGVPAVASPVGMNRDLIDSGANGYLADGSAEWERALLQLLDNISLRREFGERGRELVERSFSLESFANRYVELLRHVAQL